MHFLAELGVVPQTSNAKTDRTNRLKADLFYKLNKWVHPVLAVCSFFTLSSCVVPACRLPGVVCMVSCCPRLLAPPAHLLSMFVGSIIFDSSLFRVGSGFRSWHKAVCILTCLVLSAALLSACSCSRFNALREENEGFSKMLVCLQGFGAAAAASSEDIPQLVCSSSLDCLFVYANWLWSLLYHSRESAFPYPHMLLKAICCQLGVQRMLLYTIWPARK